jgi:hypothetical protein
MPAARTACAGIAIPTSMENNKNTPIQKLNLLDFISILFSPHEIRCNEIKAFAQPFWF